MNKTNVSIVASIVSILLSGYAVFVCDKRIEADWMGILVGILSLLVTVLIGWQIYTTINIKEELKETNTLRKEIDKKIEAAIKDMKIEAAIKDMEINFAKELGSVSSILMSLSSDRRKDLVKNLFGIFYINRNSKNFALSFSVKMIYAYLEGLEKSDQETRDKALKEMVTSLKYEEVSTFLQIADAFQNGSQQYIPIRKLLLSVLQELC